MKLKKMIAVLFVLFALLSLTSCGNATVSEAIYAIGLEADVDASIRYDLDERFSHFHLFSPNGEGWLVLDAEEGILEMIFNTKENADGSIECTLKEMYVNSSSVGLGYISNIERIKELLDGDIVFTLILENNIVTTKDLPVL